MTRYLLIDALRKVSPSDLLGLACIGMTLVLVLSL